MLMQMPSDQNPQPKKRSRALYRRSDDWRPTWNDYAEVTTALTENEIMAFLNSVIRRHLDADTVITCHTLRAITHAGLIGNAPGWRPALRESFKWIDRVSAAAAIAALQKSLAAGSLPLRPLYNTLVRRAIKTSVRMGIPAPPRPTVSPVSNPEPIKRKISRAKT